MNNKQLITIFIIIALLSVLAITLYSINHEDNDNITNVSDDRYVYTEHGRFDTVTGKHADGNSQASFDYYHSCISENGVLMSSPEEAAEYDRTH